MRRQSFVLLLFVLTAGAHLEAAEEQPRAKTPEESLRAIQVRPGFDVELVAAEPMVQDPIALAWGPDGKLWVVEMGDYPMGVDGKGKFGGRVKFLEDTDGDGKYDRATVFLDGLGFPTSVAPWRDGVLVTCAPDILYAEDTNGDGRADVRRPLYTGFGQGNQQHRVNTLAWGLDNWIYCANGDSGGKVRSLATGKAADIRGRDLRVRPDSGDLDPQSGQTQYGRSRDDWGNWFGGNNANPMYHFALADHYLRRNPHVAAPDTRVHVSVTPGTARVYPLSRTLTRFNDFHTANRFTSACSPIVYRDELFGPAFAGSTFVCEPVHNLVHREVMTAAGITFKSRRAEDEQESEFLASSDNWFRPTMVQTGPDGALWIVDMYRHVIEHPQWIPSEWQKKLNLRAGHDRGRIYRVYPAGRRPRLLPRLDRLDTAGLVAALDSPNGWQRDMAQQMLLWRQDRTAVPNLENVASLSVRPVARLHALCTLDGLDALEPSLVRRALSDSHPGVRRHAIRLCEHRLVSAPALGLRLLKLIDDPDVQVRMQLAYTLGAWDDPRVGRALGRLILRDGGDVHFRAAVLGSVSVKNLEPLVQTVLAEASKGAPPLPLVESLLRMAVAAGDRKAPVPLLRAMTTPTDGHYMPWQFAALVSLLDTLDQRNSSLARLGEGADADLRASLQQLTGLFQQARALATNPKAARAEQVAAIRLLGREPERMQADLALLTELLTPKTPDALQAAAITALGRLRDPRVPQILLSHWKGLTPALRSQVLDVLLARNDWLKAALDAVEQKQVLPSEIDAARGQRLREHRVAAIRERAVKLFAGTVDADRQRVIEGYRSALTLKSDATHGLQVFTKNCAACHRLGELGQEVGPDLAALSDKSSEYLLVNILDPNRAVEARYINYIAATKNGQIKTGVLTSETSTSITLVGTDGKPQTILRTDLEDLASSGKSAMPDGVEKDLKPQDMADLLAYLRATSPPQRPKEFAGNKPGVVHPAADGTLMLLPSNCAIYGRTLVLEQPAGNLGHWSSADDRAVWTVQVPRAGTYDVWLDWACADAVAVNSFVLEAESSRLTSKIAGTGTWDDYRQANVGAISLRPGQQQLKLHSAGRISGSLIDLKGIRLVPMKGD